MFKPGLVLAFTALLSACNPPTTPDLTYYRLQLKSTGQYLDADHCTTTLALNPGSTYADGACQLWRFVPDADGYSRLQLKSSGDFLDAPQCDSPAAASPVTLNPASTSACQLWRLVPDPDGWNHLQINWNGQELAANACTAPIVLRAAATADDAACQLWRLVPESSGLK